MKSILSLSIFAVLILLSGCATKEQKPLTIALIGDSTVTDKDGWGKAFADGLSNDVSVMNFAAGESSSKSFLVEKRLNKALEAKPDFAFIQFGHYDQPGNGFERETDPQTNYKFYLRIYIYQLKQIRARPIILSPVVRRRFDENGKIDSSLTRWAKAAKEVAAETKVPFIDLHQLSMDYHNSIGSEKSMAFNPESKDITHFNKEGAKEIASLILNELIKAVPELADKVK